MIVKLVNHLSMKLMSRQTRPMKFLHCNGSLFSCHLSSASEEISEEMALLHKNEVNLWRLNQWTCMKINTATLRAIYWLFMMSCTYFKGVGIRRFISNLQSVAVAFNRKMSCSLVGKGEGWQRKEKRQTDLLAKKAPLLSKAKRLRKIAAEIYTCSSRMIPLRRRRCLLPHYPRRSYWAVFTP